MGGAIIVEDVATIFDFAAAIAITAMAFIFPGMFYLMAEKKYLGSRTVNKGDHCWAIAFIVIGICNFFLGMFSAVAGVLGGGEE